VSRRVAFLFGCSLLLVSATAQESSSQPAAAGRLIFAVFDSSSISGSQPGTWLDPVVLMDGKQMVAPPAPNAPAAAQFAQKYFGPGKEYPLYFGGERKGTVKVQEAKPVSCRALTATVQMAGLEPLQRANFALAVAGEQPAGHKSERRLANPREVQWAASVAQKLFRQHVRRKQAYKLKAIAVLVTDVDRDGPLELIGTFELAVAGKMHRLFLVLYNTGAGYQPLISKYNVAAATDLKSDKTELFVDQLDVDGWGLDELITRSYYYQGWDYSIYRRDADGIWRKAYTGGGGGCD